MNSYCIEVKQSCDDVLSRIYEAAPPYRFLERRRVSLSDIQARMHQNTFDIHIGSNLPFGLCSTFLDSVVVYGRAINIKCGCRIVCWIIPDLIYMRVLFGMIVCLTIIFLVNPLLFGNNILHPILLVVFAFGIMTLNYLVGVRRVTCLVCDFYYDLFGCLPEKVKFKHPMKLYLFLFVGILQGNDNIWALLGD